MCFYGAFTMSILQFSTPDLWTKTVLANFDTFLLDHASAEKKAAGFAISMISHYPDRPELVLAMSELAVEEMTHFRQVIKIILEKGLQLASDTKDLYVIEFLKNTRKGTEAYFLDRLLTGAIIEARGAERFGLIAEALEPGYLKNFYTSIATSEQRHYQEFSNLAKLYFPINEVDARAAELLGIEAEIIKHLPIRAALH